MARFHFHVHDGNNIFSDEEGCELTDRAAAEIEAVRSARDLAAERVRFGKPLADCAVEVSDVSGRWFFSVPFLSLI